MFRAENIGIQISYPLFAFLSYTKITQSLLDIGAHHIPVEFCLVVVQVSGSLVAKILVGSYFFKLEE